MPSLPLDILHKLAHDEAGGVRGAVARNPSTPEALLMKLAEDPDLWVRNSLGSNPIVLDFFVKNHKASGGNS